MLLALPSLHELHSIRSACYRPLLRIASIWTGMRDSPDVSCPITTSSKGAVTDEAVAALSLLSALLPLSCLHRLQYSSSASYRLLLHIMSI